MQEIKLDAENSFIGAYIADDVSICDRIIDYFESNEYRPGTAIRDGQAFVDKKVKNSFDLTLEPDQQITKDYADYMLTALKLYQQKYEYCENTAPYSIEAINLQKYPPAGGYFYWHCERSSNQSTVGSRHLVFMTYLNDIEHEGETEFYYQKIKVKPQKGLTLIWPADWTHTHRGLPAPKEVKYIATGWLGFKS